MSELTDQQKQEQQRQEHFAKIKNLQDALSKKTNELMQKASYRGSKRWSKRDTEGLQELQQELKKKTQDMIDQALLGYDSWISTLSQIANLCKKLNEALAKEDPSGTLMTYIINFADEGIAGLRIKEEQSKIQKYTPAKDESLDQLQVRLEAIKKFAQEKGISVEDNRPSPNP